MEQAMQVNPYLFYNGNCEAAFKFYEKVLGAKIDMMMTHESAPPEMPTPPEWKKKIMHARLSIDGEVIMGSDAPPGHFRQPQGFSVSLLIEDLTDAERKFKALSEDGSVNMAFAKTFFSRGFGMCVDQFGIPWMVFCPPDS
jgi:PhnB protein